MPTAMLDVTGGFVAMLNIKLRFEKDGDYWRDVVCMRCLRCGYDGSYNSTFQHQMDSLGENGRFIGLTESNCNYCTDNLFCVGDPLTGEWIDPGPDFRSPIDTFLE